MPRDPARSAIERHWIVDQALIALLISFFTILLSVLISELQSRVGWGLLVVSLITTTGTFGLITWLVLRYVFSVSVKLSRNVQETLERYIEPEKIGWVLTTPQLVALEECTETPEIWLISADLSEDMASRPFFAVVDKNIRRGVKYRFFVPDRPDMRSRVLQLTAHRRDASKFAVTYLSSDFFFLVPEFDFVIYNPYSTGGIERTGYMGIPVPCERQHYHAKVCDDLIDVIIGKLVSVSQN